MKKYIRIWGIAAACSLLCLGSMKAGTSVDALIQRVSEGTAKNLRTEIVKGSASEGDFFEITNQGKDVLIQGNNPVSIATGFNWYLKYVAGIHIAWNNLRQPMPTQLPPVPHPIRQSTDLPLRYYLNYCTFSYSMAFWNWNRWEEELDWMAMHGVNMSLDLIGNAVVWRNLLEHLGYTKAEVNQFVAGPAFQAWWEMNNLEGWGGPNPDEWYAQQEALQKKILARMHALGIQPVLPGFAGMVPRNIGKKLGYEVADPGRWCTFPRPAFLRTDDPHFNDFAHLYYKEMEKLYGKAAYYAIDPFHEGGSTKGIDLTAAGHTIWAAMKKANPKAVWVIQAWQRNPREAMIGQLPTHDVLVLDLYSEKEPQWGDPQSAWYRPNGFGKHDWIYCMLLNFGGRVGLHGRMDALIKGYYDARQKKGKTLKGVGATAEAIENNPVMFELLYELPWRGSKRFTKEDWLPAYTAARYGSANQAVNQAWKLLAEGPYDCPRNYRGQGPVESYFCARPGFFRRSASTWGCADLFYNSSLTRRAAQLMLSASSELGGNANYRYDLVDIVRQCVSDAANDLYGQINNAYKTRDADRLQALSDTFLHYLLMQDKLLATQTDFRVGHWLGQARSLSKQPEVQKLYEWNARTLITVWGNREASERGGLHDYSGREWNGLLADFYYPQWKRFFDNAVKQLRGESSPPVDFFKMEEQWTRDTKAYPSQGEGDAVALAKEVLAEISKKP